MRKEIPLNMTLKMDIIGTIIKETRLKQKMSQADLASKLGVQKAQISKLENNTKNSQKIFESAPSSKPLMPVY